MTTKLRVSSSVIGFKERAELTWGLKEWDGVDDPCEELVFFGLYHERDFSVFETYQGKRIVFWCGSDITRLIADYERRRILKNYPDTIHYCENQLEHDELQAVGFESTIIPSFLDNINKFPLSFKVPKEGEPWKLWLCAHPEREEEYGITLAKRMAKLDNEIEFHIYGVSKPEKEEELRGIVYHGKVPEQQLNEEIREYQSGFRPNQHDGVSEVTVKSILLGQYPITRIKYDQTMQYINETQLLECIKELKTKLEPNYDTRAHWLKILNQFPWCKKEFWNPEV